jgi:hypothetical protein
MIEPPFFYLFLGVSKCTQEHGRIEIVDHVDREADQQKLDTVDNGNEDAALTMVKSGQF